MKSLVISTACECSFIALICDEKVIVKVFESCQKTSECLLPEIDKILRKNKLLLDDIECVCVCRGPGSFTGIRVGIATVKAFCFAREINFVSFDVFEVLGKGLALTRANSGGAYFFDGKKICFLKKEEVLKMQKEKIFVFHQEKEYFANFENKICVDLIQKTIDFCKEKIAKKSFSKQEDLAPIYVQNSQAENELEKKISEAKFEKLTAKNLDAILDLENECFEAPYSKSILESDLASDSKAFFGVFLGDSLVCFAIFATLFGECELERICTARRYRHLGLATKLFNFSCEKLKCKKCFLEVNKKNEFAIKLYKKLGFTLAGQRRDYYGKGEDALLLQKVF